MKAPARSLWNALPKPLVFGIFGALGGFLGATAFGEAVWRLLRPPAPVAVSIPPLRLAASPEVDLYQGGTNRLGVKIAREGFAEPVTVKALNPPAGVRIDSITIPANQTECDVQVSAAADAATGSNEIKFKAEGLARSGTPQAEVTTRLTVRKTLPPPPSLRLSVSPEVAIDPSGKNRCGVLIARDHFTGPVTLELEGLPAGVKATGLTVPADSSRIEIELSAAPDAEAVTTNVSVKATGPRGPAEAPEPAVAMSRFGLTVNTRRNERGVDVMFVLDVTGSMQFAINGVRDGIIEFAQELEKRKLDARVGLVAFRDRLNGMAGFRRPIPRKRASSSRSRTRGRSDPMPPLDAPDDKVSSLEEPFVINVAGEVFTRDYAEFGREVGRKLVADGGGDTPESSLDALVLAARQPFRANAARVLILITDAPPKIPDKETESIAEAADIIRENKIDQLHLVISEHCRDIYSVLQHDSPGTIFNLQGAASGENKFASLLPTVSREIARITTATQPSQLEPAAAARPPKPVPPPAARADDLPPISPPAVLGGVQSQEKFAVESSGRLLLAIAAWTGMITAMIAMALCAGQHHYLKEVILPPGAAARSWLGGSLAGLAGGAAGQLLFLAAPGALAGAEIFRVLGWTLLGALAGIVLSFFVPNLRTGRSLLGGALGGAAGAIGYLGITVAIHGMPAADPSGRILGATLLGLALGLTLALAERIARKAWLEICYGGCEIRTVNLGPAPVSIGSDARAATIYARGTTPVAFRYSFEAGKVIRQDAATNEVTELRRRAPLRRRRHGHLADGSGGHGWRTESIPAACGHRPAQSAAPAVAPSPPVRHAAPQTRVAAQPPPVAAAPAARPAPAIVTAGAAPSSSVAAVAPRPASSIPASPAPPPKPLAAATKPGDCPSCGRPVPGVPGRRYCIHCDLYL